MPSAGPALPPYTAFFGRDADLVLPPPEECPDAPFVYRFPPSNAGFFKRIFSQAHEVGVYITDGMARFPMNVPAAERDVFPSRVELLAFAAEPVADDGGTDSVAPVLQALALVPRAQGIFFGPLHTCEWPAGTGPSSAMEGFFFAVPDGLDMGRLCRCTGGAELVVSVMPITRGELTLAKSRGSEALLDRFEEEDVENVFDPFRESIA